MNTSSPNAPKIQMRQEIRQAYLELHGFIPPELEAVNDLNAVHTNGVEMMCFTVAVKSTGLEPRRFWPPGTKPGHSHVPDHGMNFNMDGNNGWRRGIDSDFDDRNGHGSNGNGRNGNGKGPLSGGPQAFQLLLGTFGGDGGHDRHSSQKGPGEVARSVWNVIRRNLGLKFHGPKGGRLIHLR